MTTLIKHIIEKSQCIYQKLYNIHSINMSNSNCYNGIIINVHGLSMQYVLFYGYDLVLY